MEFSLPLLLATIYIFTFSLGRIFEKIHIPWIFAALILGILLSFYNPFSLVLNDAIFQFLGELGMLFLLFLIGFELDLERLKKLGKFILKSAFFIILLEGAFGAILIHFVFHYPWLISCLIAVSFATVGEAVLVPILDKYRLIKTKLGNVIVGIGTFDDIIEILIIVLVISLASLLTSTASVALPFTTFTTLISLGILFLLSFLFFKLKKIIVERLKVPDLSALFLFVIFIFFLFIGVGRLAEAGAIGALLAGLVTRVSLPKRQLETIELEIKGVSYGLFAPLFFVWIGSQTQLNFSLFPFVFLVSTVTYGAKILASYIIGNKELGKKESILMGIALSVRFSTSIVIITLLYKELQVIGVELYSILIGSTILSVLVPFVLSYLINRWKLALIAS